MGWIDDTKAWASEGRCENKTDKEMKVCIGEPGKPHELRTLAPGESTPPGVDCDGIIRDDGGATKIHGRTGWTSEHDPGWVRDPRNWPECAKYIIGTNANVVGTTNTFVPPGIGYSVASPNYAATPLMPNGWFAGTRGASAPINTVTIKCLSSKIDIQFYLHSTALDGGAWHQGSGTVSWSYGGVGNFFLDGFAIALTRGADKYDIVYKAHVQDYGDSAFYSNGVVVGVQNKRIEGLIIAIVPKAPAPPTRPPGSRPPRCGRGGCEHYNNYNIGSFKLSPFISEDSVIKSSYRLIAGKEKSATEKFQSFPSFEEDSEEKELLGAIPIYIPHLTIPEYIPSKSNQVLLG